MYVLQKMVLAVEEDWLSTDATAPGSSCWTEEYSVTCVTV